jgi:hypothetical protein
MQQRNAMQLRNAMQCSNAMQQRSAVLADLRIPLWKEGANRGRACCIAYELGGVAGLCNDKA